VRLAYRKDIDGLRAVAVSLVLAFHVFPHEITGGFTGVDVFFVISGFLITGLIGSGLREGNFSFAEFYARRVRRIFPALATVLAAALAAGWLLLFPADYENLGKHVAGGAAFVANLTLWQDTGYFDLPAEAKPMLHLWSLGIEEQFYILWPALLWVAWRRPGGPLVLASVLLLSSFAWNLWTAPHDSASAFFLPGTRFWELMVGCVLALSLPKMSTDAMSVPARRSLLRDAASVAGVLAIGLGAALITGNGFRGWQALAPTLGAALVIAAGPDALVNRLVLSRPGLVHLGLISYPLYLWHWPILAFLRHTWFGKPSDLVRIGGVGLALALAELTYRFIETPIRRGGAPTLRTSMASGFAMVLLAGAGLAVFARAGFPQRFPPTIAALFRDDDNVAKVFVGSGRCVAGARAGAFELTTACASPPGAFRVVVWGDSHSSAITRGLAEIEGRRSDLKVVFFTTVGCPPIPSYAYTHPGLPDCPAANRAALAQIAALKPDTVLLAANWAAYDGGPNAALVDGAGIAEAVDRIRALGAGRIVGVGQFPRWRRAGPQILARAYRAGRVAVLADGTVSPLRDKSYVAPVTFAADERANAWFRAAGAAFVSPLATLCNNAGCLLTVPGTSEPMTRDEDHLTNAGAVWFVANNREALLAAP
jgi:peptidoglycan/LPS O-acetylase OafA/YrhL